MHAALDRRSVGDDGERLPFGQYCTDSESEKGSCVVGSSPCMIMPDTKSGRERNGRNKRAQLRQQLYEQELETLDEDAELPEFGEDAVEEP